MDDPDVVIVGAGLAGLTAARELAAGGVKVAVVEARDRVGGRTLSRDIGGCRMDLGGQWIGPGQHRVARLAEALGVTTFPTHCRGRKVLCAEGRVSTYAGTIPSLPPHQLLLLELTIRRLEHLRRRVPPNHPLSAPAAERLDAQTLAAWQRLAVPSRPVRDVLDAAVRVIFGAEAGELSLLHFLFYASAGGGFMHLCEIEGGAQQDRFTLGAQEISLRMAEALGDQVILGAPVRRIAQDGDGVTVHTDRGAFRGRYAIVAVPPALAGRIDYDPALPALRDGLTQRFAMGATVKCITTYDTPFWRAAGLSGEAVCTGSPVTVVFDNSPRDGASGALLSFVVGRAARAWSARPPADRRADVLTALKRFFGPRAADPIDYVEFDWSEEPWTRGCPTGTLPPGALTAFGGALRAPVGRIHWAGTETAISYPGYMEGAIESGERAALEVAGRLA